MTLKTLIDSILPWKVINEVIGDNRDDDTTVDRGTTGTFSTSTTAPLPPSASSSSSSSWIPSTTTSPSTSLRKQKIRLIITIFVFRWSYLLAMSISCLVIPDHNPGDDVLRFDMRLGQPQQSFIDNNDRNNKLDSVNHTVIDHCFCLSGHACDTLVQDLLHRISDDSYSSNHNENDGCSIYWNDLLQIGSDNQRLSLSSSSSSSSSSHRTQPPQMLVLLWKFILSPVTKWDAARFLTLAVQPKRRDPPPGAATLDNKNADNHIIINNDQDHDDNIFRISEEAHAFLPMYPIVLRTLALYYVKATIRLKIPPSYVFLPPTFEALVTFMGLLFNNVLCLVIIVLCMFELTYTTISHYYLNLSSTKFKTVPTSTSNQRTAFTIAYCTCLMIGIWNPATVFFSSNYSESFFCTTTLLGHVSMMMMRRRRQQQQQQRIPHNHEQQNVPTNVTWLSSSSSSLSLFYRSFWWLLGIMFWMVGSFTRSNGTIHCLWLIQDAIAASIVSFNKYIRPASTSTTSTTPRNVFVGVMSILITIFQSIVGIILIVLPVRYHDWKGYHRHCNSKVKSLGLVQPDWCNDNDHMLDFDDNSHDDNVQTRSKTIADLFMGPGGIVTLPFSLYTYVQEKHWNVGFFRYYTWNQIPNFLFASPIMILTFMGVFRWIYGSLVVDYGKGKLPRSIKMILIGWPIYALSNSIPSSVISNKMNHTTKNRISTISIWIDDGLVSNPILLGHYAILAVLGVVGLLIAHVQISTRMICSSSPAIWWFMTKCIIGHDTATNSIDVLSKLVWSYCCLFMILGVILHVNFLPWT